MLVTKPISKTIRTLGDLEERFQLLPTQNSHFFPEWQESLPELTNIEIEAIDQIYQRYFRHRKHSSLAEGTVNHLLVAPLLTLAKLYDEPFFITTEPSVNLEIENQNEILRGRIDTLIIHQRLWVLVVESKDSLSFNIALPQAMTYMMANPNPSQFVYGMVTSGDEFLFIKMKTDANPEYDLSNVFYTLIPQRNQLREVLQILKQIRSIILQ
ncbi:type I restriction endonuclease subunit R [Pseudanabaena yagii]|uniref:Type I restriction endonuclease subunit R n=1 Tax=Pseudanabaena yagii GIHE-NHR1 TaxID=2722753 RepID=A0ABX1LUU3_9CYAN|nr:type I restriction endonuclease subunit R [Pseudanabaena yagii]NMF58796.1 type I restriction endonuclease subunit R [Pseudanabaena yagii GIHE-NHR1]